MEKWKIGGKRFKYILFFEAFFVVVSRKMFEFLIYWISCFAVQCSAPAEKLQALSLAESMVSILGEGWLIGEIELPDVQDAIPSDRYSVIATSTDALLTSRIYFSFFSSILISDV